MRILIRQTVIALKINYDARHIFALEYPPSLAEVTLPAEITPHAR
ncbi:hypothetical protein [Arthrobacter sp. H5]|nr:hypothetical protein [Arthrobacter sp. H5]